MQQYRLSHVVTYDLIVLADNEAEALVIGGQIPLAQWTTRSHGTHIGKAEIAVAGREEPDGR